MFKNALRIGRFLALSFLLSATLSSAQVIGQGAAQLAVASVSGAEMIAEAATPWDAYVEARTAKAPDA